MATGLRGHAWAGGSASVAELLKIGPRNLRPGSTRGPGGVRADDGIELAPSAQPGENRAAGAFVWTLCCPAAPETTVDVGGAPVATVSIASAMHDDPAEKWPR